MIFIIISINDDKIKTNFKHAKNKIYKSFQ